MPARTVPLPADDPTLSTASLDELALRWKDVADRAAISAEAMTGLERNAQGLGMPGETLMEHAGTAVAAAARALLEHNGRLDRPVLILAGPGNNGGDGFVAARKLAEWGVAAIAVLVAAEEKPRTKDAARNWKRLEGLERVQMIHAPVARDVNILGQGIDKAGIVVDALLGTGVRGQLRDPIREAVGVIHRARELGVPVLAVDTPTAVDLTSGDPSDPVVRADLTVTFHRPKTGLRARIGKALAGRILVAPIGIPPEVDRA
ncbi:MAG TPA: NAD(P)H-hydrate epimerase [Candidatus Limnocylindrales bacterium]|nr:NAD(P)H-hydrate epimerase [Candidatus Limnocylindrales bacterium]